MFADLWWFASLGLFRCSRLGWDSWNLVLQGGFLSWFCLVVLDLALCGLMWICLVWVWIVLSICEVLCVL